MVQDGARPVRLQRDGAPLGLNSFNRKSFSHSPHPFLTKQRGEREFHPLYPTMLSLASQ